MLRDEAALDDLRPPQPASTNAPKDRYEAEGAYAEAVDV